MSQQLAAVAAARAAPDDPAPDDVFAYAMDYGTGKSGVILDEWGEMATSGGPQDLLVIAPAGSIRNWYVDKTEMQLSEINAQMNPAFVERMTYIGWDGGNGVRHRENLARFLRARDRPRALFVNVEALSNSESRARELVQEYLEQRGAYEAIDESPIIKGRKAQRTKFIVRTGEDAIVRRLATGRLTPKGPTDLFSQFNFLDWRIIGCKSWQSFEGRYCVTRRMETGGKRFDVIVGYRELDDLRDRIAPYTYRVRKEDCLDLDPKKFVLWEVEHTAEQRRLYKELRADATAMLSTGEFVSTDHVMTMMMRMHQINLGFVIDENGHEHDVLSNRESDLLEILGQHRGKTIIWCPYVRPLLRAAERVEREYGPGSVARFWGGNKRTRGEDEKRFLGDPKCTHMFSTQGAGRCGNTWNVADLTIFMGNSNDLEHRENSEDRNHRKGQTNRVTYVDMIVPGTVDYKNVERLRKKMNLGAMMTGEEARAWLI